MGEARQSGALELSGLGERELVALARRGEPAAFGESMRRHNRRLFRAARNVLGDDAEAEDAVQEAYLRAFRDLDGFRGEASLSTWLTRIALNETLERGRPAVDLVDAAARQYGGARVLVFPTVAAHDGGSDPEGASARRQVRRLLEEAIDALPEPFRLVLVARNVDGISVEEAAEALGLRPETVRTRLHRVRRSLRGALEERLGDALRGAFPFEGARCAWLAEAVLARLEARDGPARTG
jgi:RNA polymerase sigma-70 factor, ECF subfamily